MADASKDEPRAQVRIGEGDSEEWGLLPFAILKVYSDQKLTDATPGHVDGGDWTFFDCRTDSPPSANFTIGVRAKSSEGKPVVWGEATILVANRDEGVKLLDLIGRAFKLKSPAERKQQPLEPWKFNTAVLGDGMKREPQGGFAGQGGSWSATKWFLERDGFYAEVYFNYNLKEMKGEFSEKDPDYREDLLAVLAIAVRDGPRPERTPQTDPNLTDVGPRFGNGQLLAKGARYFLFTPGGKLILFSSKLQNGATALFAVAPDKPDDPKEAARVQQELDGVKVLDPDASQLLIVELMPKERGVFSSEDPNRLWWVDRTKKETRELKGPWEGKRFRLAEKPVSPDGRFVVITSWRSRADGNRGNYSVIHVLHLMSGTMQTIELVNHSLEPIGWFGSGKDLRLVFLKDHRWDRDKTQEWFLGEPETGKYAPAEKSPLVSDELARRLSPDGGLVAVVEGKDRLTITDVKTRQVRSLVFHEDDHRFVHEEGFEWVSPRYLLLHLNRLVFLDVQTMKMSYPLGKEDESRSHTFSPDFRWVLWQEPDGGLHLSTVVIPPDAP